MIMEVSLIVLSLTVIVGLLTADVRFKKLENRINCLEDNMLDNFGEIKKGLETLELQEINNGDIIMEKLSSNKENVTKEINNLYSKLVFTPLVFKYGEKGESNGRINSNK
ncbi:hypothetical protein [Clostridium sp. Marseille-QA1073]